MGQLLIGIVVLWIVGGIVALANFEESYSRMTEEEFEQLVRRTSALGAAVAGLQKVIEGPPKVEFIRQEKTEAERADSGGNPVAGS